MTLFQDAVGTPRAAGQFGDVLAWYGAIGDAALGNASDFARRKASLAVALGSIASLPAQMQHATFFAGMLHAIGAIGNPAYRKGNELPERALYTARWDVPAHGARACTAIAALTPMTADLVRWQSECWDGTGYPDQLRWQSIPVPAAHLALADTYARTKDPEEALSTIALQSGRMFGPDATHTFVTWFHASGGEVAPLPLPLDALDASQADASALLDDVADRIDAHNAVPGRWRTVDRLAQAAAQTLELDADAKRALSFAARLYAAGELHDRAREDEAFDPLSRLGIETRARNAQASAELVAAIPSLRDAGAILAARAQWYDGTAQPGAARGDAIPLGARILSGAITYTRLDRGERLATAAGTQFDPRVVRAVLEAARVRA